MRRKHEYVVWKDAGNGYGFARCWCGGTATVSKLLVKEASKRHDDASRKLAEIKALERIKKSS